MKKKPAKIKSKPRKVVKKKAAAPRRAVIPADCASLEAVYDILGRDLGLPPHFGRNLDALYDVLTGDVPGPFEIVVEDAKRLGAALVPQGSALLKLLADVAKARKDARIRVKST
jgi:ribonuclease inhibitor